MSYAEIQAMALSQEGRASPSEKYGRLFDTLWDASSYWWISCRSLDEVHASCLDNLDASVADVLDASEYGMEQLATDLRDGTGKSSPGDLVEALKESLMHIFGTGDGSSAASGSVYDPATVKSIAEYGYDSEDYAPGWWMGYNTRDEVWMFSLSGDTRPDDASQWVPRLEGGPRYSGVAPYSPGWWYGLDAVDNTWKYYWTDSPDGPTGKALRHADGWKTEAELNQPLLQEPAWDPSLLEDRIHSWKAEGEREVDLDGIIDEKRIITFPQVTEDAIADMMWAQGFLEKFELDVPYNGKISTTIGPITNYGEFTCGSISGMFLDLDMRDSENLLVVLKFGNARVKLKAHDTKGPNPVFVKSMLAVVAHVSLHVTSDVVISGGSVEARTYVGSGYRIEKGAYAGAAIIDYYDSGRLVRTERR